MLGENSDKIGPKCLDALIWSSDTTGHNIESQIQFSDKRDLAELVNCCIAARWHSYGSIHLDTKIFKMCTPFCLSLFQNFLPCPVTWW